MANVNVKKDLEAKLIMRAWEDPTFKQELLSNPKAAIQKALEVNIPEGIDIKVVEETSNTYYLVLPQNPTQSMALDPKSDKGGKAQTAVY